MYFDDSAKVDVDLMWCKWLERVAYEELKIDIIGVLLEKLISSDVIC